MLQEKSLYTVVVVDDEEELRQAVCQMVNWELLGFRLVGSACNGLDALDLIEKFEPDLLLTDIRIRGLCHLVFPHGLSDLISAHQNNSNQANGNHVERPISNPHRQGRVPKRFFPPQLRFPLRRPLLLTSRTCSVLRIFIFPRVHMASFYTDSLLLYHDPRALQLYFGSQIG